MVTRMHLAKALKERKREFTQNIIALDLMLFLFSWPVRNVLVQCRENIEWAHNVITHPTTSTLVMFHEVKIQCINYLDGKGTCSHNFHCIIDTV